MKHVALLVALVGMSGCQSEVGTRVPLHDSVTSIDVVIQKISPRTATPDVRVTEPDKVRAVSDFVSNRSSWIASPESKIAKMPTASGYSFWIVLRYLDGTNEVIGVKETELIRNGYRSRISERQHERLAKLCDLITVGPFTLD